MLAYSNEKVTLNHYVYIQLIAIKNMQPLSKVKNQGNKKLNLT